MNEPVRVLSSQELPEALKAAFAALYDIDCEIADLKAEHISPVTDERTAKWRTLKAASGIARKDLELYYKLYKRDRDAGNMDDEADGEEIKSNLRRVFAALREGETLDWIGAATGDAPEEPRDDDDEPLAAAAPEEDEGQTVEDVGEAELAEAASGAPTVEAAEGPDADWGDAEAEAGDAEFDDAGTIFNMGKTAGEEGAAALDNPYPADGIKRATWERGRKAGIKASGATPSGVVLSMTPGFSGTEAVAAQ